jgi:adsorption protein B
MMSSADALVAAFLVPLAVVSLLSGLDDLVLDVVMVWTWLRRRPPVSEPRPPESGEKRIAVFVPLWQEHAVIGKMLQHNLDTIRHANYYFFVGCYPNDRLTLDEVRRAEGRLPNVCLAIVPHDGPTSKADCLNWIYQGMLAHEEACGVRFEVVVLHDAEDVVHPESLRWIDHYSEEYDMVQIPVLPLATPGRLLTHGAYCDEFAEFQTKDVPAREALGGFLPSNGVGTGYTRRALEKLAESDSNRVFDPGCLTEDYNCGIRLHRLGFRQTFIPIQYLDGRPVATREYFPQRLRQAVKQRTRWVTGIALQGWERYGWSGGPASVYWFWRDRKGLIGNPLSLLANLIGLYGLVTWLSSRWTASPWGLQQAILGQAVVWLFPATLVMQAHRLLVRAACSARIYGWAFATGVPIRAIWANWMNAAATIIAVFNYVRARLLRQPQAWLKTEHTYPAVTRPQVLTPVDVAPQTVRRETARSLPLHIVRRWNVLPVGVGAGQMTLATPQPPSETLEEDLRRFTRLTARYQLVSPSNFERLTLELL